MLSTRHINTSFECERSRRSSACGAKAPSRRGVRRAKVHGDDARRRGEGARGVSEGVPYVREPRARALTDQMYVLQPDNGPSRTSSGSPAALLDLVEAIVSRAFSLEPLPPHYVECPHMAT